MSLDTIPGVVIDNSGGYKFITCKISDDAGNEKIVVRANGGYRYHFKLVEALQREMRHGIKVHCLGGGRIDVMTEEKRIIIWDESTNYGKEPDRAGTTVALLQAAFPEYQVGERKSDFGY